LRAGDSGSVAIWKMEDTNLIGGGGAAHRGPDGIAPSALGQKTISEMSR
jgi:hypothetical protein